MARLEAWIDRWSVSQQGARLAANATSLIGCALTFTLVAFVWWNLQPELVGVIELRPDNLEVKRLGPGWPIPAYTGRSQWGRADVPAEQLFNGPRARQGNAVPLARPNSWWTRVIPNAFFGALLVSAILANIARGRRDDGRADADDDGDVEVDAHD
jgi:hypothetical protein